MGRWSVVGGSVVGGSVVGGWWVSGRWSVVGGSVVDGFNKTHILCFSLLMV